MPTYGSSHSRPTQVNTGSRSFFWEFQTPITLMEKPPVNTVAVFLPSIVPPSMQLISSRPQPNVLLLWDIYGKMKTGCHGKRAVFGRELH